MQITATISNYRALASATLEIGSITLVSGQNEAGKSSTLQAIAAALTGEPLPVEDVKKSSAGVLVRSGTAGGFSRLESPEGTAQVTWPAAKVKTTGRPPQASQFAAGLQSVVTMDAKTRTAFLIDYLGAKPDKAALQAAVASLKIDTGTLDKLWQLIEQQGWDGAYKIIKDKGATLKGKWETITNDDYGPKKADSWIPEGYSVDLEGTSEATLKACVTDARDNLEAAIAGSAVDDSKRGELEALAALAMPRKLALADARKPLPENPELNGLVAKLATARIAVADCQKDLDESRRVLDGLPTPDKPAESYGCPHCKERVQVIKFSSPDKYDLVKWEPSNPERAAVKQKAIDAQRAKNIEILDRLNTQTKTRDDLEAAHRELSSCDVTAHAEHLAAVREAERLVKECEDAQAALGKEIMQTQGKPVEACRNDLAAGELRLKAYTSKRDADSTHATILLNQELLAHIAPTGVRSDVLLKSLAPFNAALTQFSGIAGWKHVCIEPDFSFTAGGTAYYLLSQSAQWRVRVIVQVAMADREHADMLVIDGADILDKGGRNGLFALLYAIKRPAVVGMTINKKEDMPNLAAAGFGKSYWIADGVAAEVS